MPEGTASDRLEKFRKLYALNFGYLRYIGLWNFDSGASVLSKSLYYAYNKLTITIMFIFATTLFADIYLSFNDLSIVTDDGCIFAGIFVVLFKVMLFQIRRERIARLLDDAVESCRRLCTLSTSDENEILDKYLLVSRLTFYGFSVLGFFLVIALLFLVPVEDGCLPIRARYPFDTTKSPWHEVGYFVETYTIFFGIIAIVGMDGLQTHLCILFLIHFEILNAHFSNCGRRWCDVENSNVDVSVRYKRNISIETSTYDRNNYKWCEPRDDFADRFGTSVRDHQRLLGLLEGFNEIFSPTMFIQMFGSTLMICLTCFQTTLVVDSNSNVYKFFVYLLAAVSQLFYFCWLGNEVIYQNASLAHGQWFSGWSERFSIKTGRLVILSMIFTRRTRNLRAGVFYVLSMETFIVIMRGSYSFFALLNTMQSKVDQ